MPATNLKWTRVQPRHYQARIVNDLYECVRLAKNDDDQRKGGWLCLCNGEVFDRDETLAGAKHWCEVSTEKR